MSADPLDPRPAGPDSSAADPATVSTEEAAESRGDAPPAIDLSSIPDTLPLLPMEDTALYPFTIVPLAFEDPPLIAAVVVLLLVLMFLTR